MSLVESAESWLRQTFTWSNSWATWRERLVGLLFLFIAGVLLLLNVTLLSYWPAIILWSIYGLIVAFASRQGWIKLFGPVLFYDMVRTARRSRYAIIRILYGGFLFLILSYMFMLLTMTPRFGRELTPRDTAVMAEGFFATFMIVQLVLVVLLTPSYVAGAIAEEKDRKTMEFLLATDLRNREIILSKLVSRLGSMALLLLTGLPILSILQLIGGVDVELMLAGFAAVGLTTLGIASISILLSTLFKKPRDAISLTYLFLIAYGSLTLLGTVMSQHRMFKVPIWFGDDPPTFATIILALNAGNPVIAVWDVTAAIMGQNRAGVRTNLATELPIILTRYAWFHLVVSVVCIAWSIIRVRAISLKQSTAGTTASLHFWEHFRPSVGSFPMFWKEVFIDGRTKFNWLAWLAVMVLVLLTLGTGVWILGEALWNADRHFGGDRDFARRMLSQSMNIWFRTAGTCVGCLTLIMMGVRAATGITSERERDTLDALITTPLSAEGMLAAKVVGNLTSLRPAWFWFGSMMLLALFTGGLHPLAIPMLIYAWFVYALFVTMAGLAFSLFCKSSIWSSLFTVLTTLVLGGGHWIITSCCCIPMFGMVMMPANQNRAVQEAWLKFGEYFIKFQAGVTPPFVFVWGSVTINDDFPRERVFWELIGFSVLGLFLWTIACAILWFAVLVPRFKHLARRIELE